MKMTDETGRDIDETEPLQRRPLSRPVEAELPKTCMDKIKNCLSVITVEPAAFLMLFASVLAQITTQTLSIEKACRVNLNLSEAICDSLRNQDSDNNTANEQLVQAYVANNLVWKSALQTALPCILFPFVGGWMDMTGRRKIIMILPIIGEVFQNLSNILNIIFFYQLPLQVLLFFDVFFGNIFGSWSVMFLAIFCYIADITTEENRTHRLGLVSFFTYVGMPIGLALSGILLKSFGYYAIYGTAMTLHLLNLCYITFLLSDPPRTKQQREHDGRGLCYTLKSFFDLKHIKNTMKVVFKTTADNRRLRLIILLLAVCILFGPMYGEMSIFYLSTRYRFNWDEVKYSMFQTYNFVINTIGTIFAIMVFSKCLKWHDSIMGIIACVSKIGGAFVYCFAPNGKIFLIAPAVDIFGGTSLLALRSIFSKSVAPDELGKLNSIVGLCENLMPLIYVSLYTNIYTATMDVLPGAVFLVGAALSVPAVFVFIWLFIRYRRGLENPPKIVEANDHAIAMT